MNTDFLNQVKFRCGIPAAITVYDEAEIIPLVNDCFSDMAAAGVPSTMLIDTDTDPRVITAVVLYVQGHRGSDRSDTTRYERLYHNAVFKLSLEPEAESTESTTDTESTESTDGTEGG